MSRCELTEEITRLNNQFADADPNKINALSSLIEQAAYETLYLKKLNAQALNSGLVKIHPDNPTIQQALPISTEISKHSAALTNIMDKLIKHLAVENDDDDEGLGEYE